MSECIRKFASLNLSTLITLFLLLSIEGCQREKEGCLLQMKEWFMDSNTLGYRETYTYNTNNHLLRAEGDYGGDGTVDYDKTYTCDANGNILMVEFDYDVDGTIDTLYTYTYDINNNILTEEEDWGSTVHYRNAYTYDSNGHKLANDYYYYNGEFSGTGRIDYTYKYYNNGDIFVMYESDSNLNVDVSYRYTYDTHGNMLTEEMDIEIDGVVDSLTTYTYDDNDNILTEGLDTDANGSVDYLTTYTYDC